MSKPKILLFDIESSPNLAYVWGKWEQNVISFKKEWELLSFAYKWLDEKQVFCTTRFDFRDKTDKSLVKALHDILNEADVVIAHNGDQFDIKKANAKFIEHSLGPTSSYQKIDTKKVAKRYFNFNSNSLDDLGNLLGVGRKAKTGGFDLWLDFMAGLKTAGKKMAEYNKQDVVLLEKVYLRLRPWMDNHPNLNTLSGKPDNCPKCGGNKLKSKGYRHNKTTTYKRYICLSCGGQCTSRSPEKEVLKTNLV